MPEGDTATLSGQLVEGLQRGSFAVVAPEEVSAAASNADRCDNERCFKKIAEDTGSTHVVRAVVTVKDRDYAVKVFLIDGTDGAVIATSDESCEICGVADVGGLISTSAATLRTKLDALASGPSTLVLTSDPAGATVTLDGEIIGVSPLDRPIIPGKHILRVSKEGYIALEREVTFVEGVEETVDFKLDKLPSRLPGRAWGWATLGIGIAALGAGITFTVLHDGQYNPDCSEGSGTKDSAGECKFLWDTKWLGAGLGIGGAALTTLGIAILLTTTPLKAKKQKDAKKADANIGVGLGSLVVHGRF